MATTRLHAAAAAGDVSAVKMLLSSSTTDTICALDEFGQTPLVLAAEHGRAQVVELLLDNGADPNVPDSRGRSALHWAANQHDEEGVRALLSHKVSAMENNLATVLVLCWLTSPDPFKRLART
jgi:ankyrin repeat protein